MVALAQMTRQGKSARISDVINEGKLYNIKDSVPKGVLKVRSINQIKYRGRQ